MLQARHCSGCLGYIKPRLPGAYSLVEETKKPNVMNKLTIYFWKMTVDKGKGERETGDQEWGRGRGWVRIKVSERAFVQHFKEEVRELVSHVEGTAFQAKGPASAEASEQDQFWNILGTGRRTRAERGRSQLGEDVA